jgi:hypothetical protein
MHEIQRKLLIKSMFSYIKEFKIGLNNKNIEYKKELCLSKVYDNFL